MKTTELKKLMSPHVVDVQGDGINEFYTPEQVVEILRVVGRSEQLKAFADWFQKNGQLYEWGIDESVIDDYLKSL